MNEREARVRCVTKLLGAHGQGEDAERVAEIVAMTGGIPWVVPALSGEKPTGKLLFTAAVASVALSRTFGTPGAGEIFEAAVAIAGIAQTAQGHTAPRRWVRDAKRHGVAALLEITPAKLLELEAGNRAASDLKQTPTQLVDDLTARLTP